MYTRVYPGTRAYPDTRVYPGISGYTRVYPEVGQGNQTDTAIYYVMSFLSMQLHSIPGISIRQKKSDIQNTLTSISM